MGLLENVDFKYPKEPVQRYGAKAGLLMYVAGHLPQIPQMPMVASEIGESPKDFLGRVDQDGIPWPRIFRSSAVAELVGFEGDFPTHTVDTFKGEDKISRCFILDGDWNWLGNDEEFNKRLEALTRKIANSTKSVDSDYQLPPEINVIAAEYACCRYTGALIKHPNRQDYYLTTITDDIRDKLTLTYNPEEKFSEFGTNWGRLINFTDDIEAELKTVIGWHDLIADLPEMDSNWTYLLEYGLMPARLFQVHYFKKTEKAAFDLDSKRGDYRQPIVLGITPREGEDYELTFSTCTSKRTELPRLLHKSLHHVSSGDEDLTAYSLYDCAGILAHQDVKVLRQSKLAVLYPQFLFTSIYEGTIVNVVSDGTRVRVTNKLTGEEIS